MDSYLDDCGAVAGGGLNLRAVTHDVAAAARALADTTHAKFLTLPDCRY
jgi:hypothetical protein